MKKTTTKTKKKVPVKVQKKVKEEEKKEEQKSFISHEEMTDALMDELLLELPDSIFWQAILKFNRLKDGEVINSLYSVDPFKEPTLTARSQGFRGGLYALENKVVADIKRRNDEAEGKDQEPEKKTQGY